MLFTAQASCDEFGTEKLTYLKKEFRKIKLWKLKDNEIKRL